MPDCCSIMDETAGTTASIFVGWNALSQAATLMLREASAPPFFEAPNISTPTVLPVFIVVQDNAIGYFVAFLNGHRG
ncbi:hypothetical protein [Acidithiobacillus marinus]|uniref:hypothetical protein n=1 Tax=Acidithiobacillus marinus TaxID=187490 RepID=UPI0034A2E260